MVCFRSPAGKINEIVNSRELWLNNDEGMFAARSSQSVSEGIVPGKCLLGINYFFE